MAYWVLWPIYTHSHRVFLITESVLKCNNLSNLLGCVSRNSPCLIGFPCDIDLGFWRFVAAVVGWCFLASPKLHGKFQWEYRNLPKSHKISRDLCYVRLRCWVFCHPSCRIFGEVFCSCLGATQCKIISSYNSGHVSSQRCRYTDT